MKKKAVALSKKLQAKGTSRAECAGFLGLTVSMLWRWEHPPKKAPRPVGRPRIELPGATRRSAQEFLRQSGLRTGFPRVAGAFPNASPRALGRLLDQHRAARLRGRTLKVSELEWLVPGAVWAIDYTVPPKPVDGIYDSILYVRDLASYRILAAQPLERATAEETRLVLLALFAEHGAPLVIKSDNGSHFTAESVAATLAQWSVLQLLSPPYRPGYNGSCEAGIGSLSSRTSYEAARHGRAGAWSSDDVAVAAAKLNSTLRPWGARGSTPDKVWKTRTKVSDAQRRALAAALHKELYQLVSERRLNFGALADRQSRNVKREVISRALVARGLLLVRGRRIRLTLTRAQRRKVS